MVKHVCPTSPFGDSIHAEDILEIIRSFQGWEDKYRQVIQWGKMLPQMPESDKVPEVLVSGCESQVWLTAQKKGQRWYFQVDSDARIVRGLIAMVVAIYQGKTTKEIASFDVAGFFEQMGLLNHLSPSRGNGLWAIVSQIRILTVPPK